MKNVKCPNKNLLDWKDLVQAVGENNAYYLWDLNNSYGLDKAPNGEPSKLFESLLRYTNGDRMAAMREKAKVYSEGFKNWFGDWVKVNHSKVKDDNQSIDYLFDINPELSEIGSKQEYQSYIDSIFPDSKVTSIYWHGTDSDFSNGIDNSERGRGSGAPETGAEMYFNKQPWASLLYISGVNRNVPDREGFNNWVKLWWELKEILGNGLTLDDNWKDTIISNVRKNIPNKRGVFNRDKGGDNGSYLSERKAKYGYENKSDKLFFEEVFGIRYGQETFRDWVKRNEHEFKHIWENKKVRNGIYPVVLNVENPITERGQNTYYEEQRGLMTKARQNNNDAIISDSADNEFNSDVVVILNPRQNVHVLGTKQDIEQFREWKLKNSVSKVVDENGEPLIVYRGVNNNNANKRYVYYTKNEQEARIYASGLFTKGGNFYSNHNDTKFAIESYLSDKYGISTTDIDYLLSIIEDFSKDGSVYDAPIYEEVEEENDLLGITMTTNKFVGTRKETYKSSYTRKDYDDAVRQLSLFNTNKEVIDLLNILHLIDSTTITDDSQIVRQYDDENYAKNVERLSDLTDTYNDVITENTKGYHSNVERVFLNIKRPYTEEYNAEDLIHNENAYKNEHDGAILSYGDHFLVRRNTDQIVSVANNTLETTNNEYYSKDNLLEGIEEMVTDLPSERVERVSNYLISKLTLKTRAYRPRSTKHFEDLISGLELDLFGVIPSTVSNIRDSMYLDEIQFFIYNTLYDRVTSAIEESRNSLRNIRDNEISWLRVYNVLRSYLYDDSKKVTDYNPVDRNILSLLSDKAIKRDKKAIGYYKHMLASTEDNKLKSGIRGMVYDSSLRRYKLLARINKLLTILDTLDIVPGSKKMMFDKYVSEYMRYLIYENRPVSGKESSFFNGFTDMILMTDMLNKWYNAPYETNQIFSLKLMEEGTNAKDALQSIIENSNNPEAVELARTLLPYASESTKIRFIGVNRNGKLSVGGTFFGDTGNVEIYAFTELFQRHPEFVVLHEIVHSLSVYHIKNNPKLYKNLQDIIDFLKQRSPLGQYALSNPYELIAEFLSNPLFREYTRKIKVKGDNVNLFLRILNAILNWIRPKDRLTVFDYLDDISKNIIAQQYLESQSNLESYSISLNFNLASSLPKDQVDLINKVYEKILKGLEALLKSVKRYQQKNPRLWNELGTLISKLGNSEAEQGMLQFMQHVLDRITFVVNFLLKPINLINAKQIRQLSQDYLGFYKPLLDDILALFDTTDIFKTDPNYADILAKAQALSVQVNSVNNRFKNILVKKGKDELVSFLNSQNVPQQFIDEALLFLDNPANDVSFFTDFFGMASNSNIMVIQVIANILNNVMNETSREVTKKGILLTKLAEAAKKKYGIDVLKLLFEKGKDGKYTGYIVRKYNYGQYLKDKREYLDKLADKLGIKKDKNGMYDLPSDDNIQRQWFDGLNKFYSDRLNRKYSAEYYATRNTMLSMKSREALDEIQDAIDAILSRVVIDGIEHSELFTDAEFNQLNQLRKLKQLLANPYNLDGSAKTGDDLQIANEISAFNDLVNLNVKREEDWDAYNRDLKEIIQQYGGNLNDPRVLLWIKRNTKLRYTQEFYDRIEALDRVPLSQTYKDLVEKRKKLLLLFRDSQTQEIDASTLSDQERAMLLQLDLDIANATTVADPNSLDPFRDKFRDFAEMATTAEYLRDYQAASKAGLAAFNEWFFKNHYTDAFGNLNPASYYTVLKPKAHVASLYTETVPTGRYTKVDPSSNWANPDFDPNGPSLLLNMKYYDNSEAYNAIMSKPELKALYDEIAGTMSESMGMIPFINNANDGRMPLMHARTAQVLARKNGLVDRAKYVFDEVLGIQPEDINYVDDFDTMPNGDPIKIIPTRFIDMLEDTNSICTDAVASVTAFYNMAVNFRNMSNKRDDIELLLNLLSNTAVTDKNDTNIRGKESNIYKQAELLVDRLMYGRNKNPIYFNIMGKRVNIAKTLDLLRSFITKVNLSGNIWSIGTSFITDVGYTTLEAKLGRYFDGEDLRFAIGEYYRRLPKIMENIGQPVPRDKVANLMLLNHIVRDNRETFNRIDQSKIIRAISNNFWYAGYTMSDYYVKSHTLMSIYHNYRLVNGEFISKAEFINKYYPTNKKRGKVEFKLYNTTLFDAYDEEGNVLPLYELYVPKSLQNRVQNRIDVITRRVDGTLREVDKAAIHADALGQYGVMHHNFMIHGVHDRFKKRQFNLDTGMIEEGYYRSTARFLKNIVGNRHFALKQILEDYDNLADYELYAIRRVLYETMLFTSTTLISLCLAALVDGDDDWDNWFMLALTYLALRSSFEFRTMYNPLELVALIKSPTAAFSWFENASAFINLFNPYSYIGKGNPFDIIDRGVYKGMPRILRNIIKLTPIRSIIEAQDPKQKRNYLQNQLMSF